MGTPTPEEINTLISLLNQQEYQRGELLARALTTRFPQHGFSWYALGSALKLQGRSAEGIGPMLEAAALLPHDGQVRSDLGVLYRDINALTEAEACYLQALELNPNSAITYCNLGNTLYDQGRLSEAEASYRQALDIVPDSVTTLCGLGRALHGLGRLSEAEASYRQALGIAPDTVAAFCGLGDTLHGQGRLSEAEVSYRRALRLQPDTATVQNNLGVLCKDLNRYSEAEEQFRRALLLTPDDTAALNNLGNMLRDRGLHAAAADCYQQALLIAPDNLELLSNLLFGMQYSTPASSDAPLLLARQYGRAAAQKAVRRYSSWDVEEQPSCLKVGLVSGDLRNHPVGFFLEGLLAKLDRRLLELTAYPTSSRRDELTTRIQPFFAAWKPLTGISDESAAAMIHADRMHLLIDLAGHTADNRLALFAWKPAPVQATWLGYLATTGISEIDYIIGDPQATPPEHAHQYQETVWRMPEIWACFTPPADSPEINPLPALSNGYLTFGCFNNLSKIHDGVMSLWARILTAIPQSRLLLKTRQLSDAVLCDMIRQRFAEHGIPPDRLILEGASPRTALLAAYQRVDVALDPFPYTGGTTSFEALWMAVPVITLRGDSFLGRSGLSVLHNAGLAAWIAETPDAYLAKAVACSQELQTLANLRSRLRQQVAVSPLFDSCRFARQFEKALWEIWKKRLKSK